MVAVDVAMARSLRGSPWDAIKDAVIRSVAADLAKRDVSSKITDVKTAFSSWDNCMNADFCKWPVIAVIAIGGLIILSIVWCIVRCCCCGLSCCCSCFECLKCCGNCCGCCDPPGGRKHKHLDDPYAPAPDHGYRNEAPMQVPGPRFDAQPTAPALSATPAIPATRPVRNEPPQYAEFEMSKSGNEDALPEMPSWESAGSKKVMVEEEAVELEDLKKTPVSEKPTGVMNGTSTSPSQGRSPYGQPEGNHSGYLNANRAPDHYSPIDQGYGYNSNTGASEAYEMDAGTYGTGAAMGAGRRSPAQGYNDGYNANNNGYGANNNSSNGYGVNNNSTGYGNANSNGYGNLNSNGYSNSNNGYGNNTRNNGYGNMSNNGYGRDAYNQTPSNSNQGYGQSQTPAADYSNNYGNSYQRASPAVPTYGTDARMRQSPAANPRRTPGPRQDPYGYGQAARKSPAPLNDYGYGQPPAPQQSTGMNRAFSPAPDRQYGAASPRPLAHPVPQRHYGGIEEPPQSPITNNSGFDFNSGYSRPPQSPSSPAEPYPGYKPYSPKP